MERAFRMLLAKAKDEGPRRGNIHILRFYSSYVLVRDGKAVEATEPVMAYCPLAGHLYRRIRFAKGVDAIKRSILDCVNEKIDTFGHFTGRRRILRSDIAIPYGASEMLMYALSKRAIDAAVLVCDGAGTVIVKRPDVAQGIGARMNGLFYTSAVTAVIKRLEETGSRVLSREAVIKQAEGVKKAAALGYKKIALTVNASSDESLKAIRKIENACGISLTILAVCTTGISKKRTSEINRYADLVWSCASKNVRAMIGRKAVLQLSRKIPVFVLTKKGLDLAGSYSSAGSLISALDARRQYIIAGRGRGRRLMMGDFNVCLSEARLPVADRKEPRRR